jgi:flagellar biosynthesis GTPase FlhF
MRTLNIAPEVLIPLEADLLDITDVPLRVSTKLELERRRYARIQRILAERNRILSLPALPPSVSGAPTVRRKGAKRKDLKKRPTGRSPPQLPVITATQISVPVKSRIPHYCKLAVKQPLGPEPKQRNHPAVRTIPAIADAQARRNRVAQVQRAAAIRMAKAKEEESVFDQRRRKLREASEARMQSLARDYMRLQERKQKALEEERAWRRANLYFPKEAITRKANAFSELRKEFLSAFTQPPPLSTSPTKTRITPSTLPLVSDTSIGLGKRSRIPAANTRLIPL